MIELSKFTTSRLWVSYYLLKLAYGVIVLVVGLDKFLHFLSPVNEDVISPHILSIIPLSATHILYLVGVLEILIALLIFSKWTRWGAYLLMAWYIIIIINLLTMKGYYILSLSNAGHAVANFVLAQLSVFTDKQQGM